MLRRSFAASALACSLACASPAFADLDHALADYESGDFAPAFQELSRLSAGGDGVNPRDVRGSTPGGRQTGWVCQIRSM